MVPIPMLMVNGDICRNVREYSPQAEMCNDVWRGDAVLVCQCITFNSYICNGNNGEMGTHYMCLNYFFHHWNHMKSYKKKIVIVK